MIEKLFNIIKWQAIVFLLFMLLCFVFNRFAVDDYYFIGEINAKSFTEIYTHLQLKWHGRWTSNFLLLFFIQFHQLPYFLFFYHLFTFSLFLIAVYQFIKALFIRYNIILNRMQILTYSIVFVSIFFFCTVTPNESWFWYTSSVVYFWSIIAVLFSLKILFINYPRWYDYLIFLLGLIYVGGSNEPLALFISLGCISLLFKRKYRVRTVIGLAILIISFSINYFSQGTIHRNAITPDLNFIDIILYSGYGTIKYLLFSFHSTFLIALLLGVPFYYAGKIYKKNKMYSIKKELVYSLLCIGIVAFVNQLIVVIALGSLPPNRSMITTSLIISFVIIRLFFILGNHYKKAKFNLLQFSFLSTLLLISFCIYYTKVHYKYSKSLSKRIEMIKKSEEQIIKVPELPYSGYIYSAEITTNPKDFKNQHLKYGLGVKQDIVLGIGIP